MRPVLFFAMPYDVFEQGNKYCVYKVKPNGQRRGKTLGCHPTADRAYAQITTIESNEEENKELMMPEDNITTTIPLTVDQEPAEEKACKGCGDLEKMDYFVPMEITSFAALDTYMAAEEAAAEITDTTNAFMMLARNVMNNPDIADKAMALSDLSAEMGQRLNQVKEADELKAVWSTALVNTFPDSSFLYIKPGGEKDGEGKTTPRSLRMFPYKDAEGKVDLPHLRNAIARAPQADLPENIRTRVQNRAREILANETKEDEGWLDKIIGAVGHAFGLTPKQEPEQKEKPQHSGMMFWKEANGQYSWIARYSNNFRDKDNPPEIIAAKSHRRFVELVDKKQVDLPELWLWHVKEWKWGKAQWVAYDDSGFALAGGVVDKGFEPLAEMIMELNADDVRVSHGMPKSSIKYDGSDPSVIVEHVTREISPLPAWAAANDLTGFIILTKETQMAIPKDKREALKEEWNLPDEILGGLEAANQADAKEAQDAGIETKENDEVETEQEQPQEPQEAAPVAEEKPLTREELGEVVTQIGQAITTLNQSVTALAGEVKELKEAQAIEEKMTLTDMFKSAAGHPDAQIDGRSKLAKSKPKEQEALTDSIVMTGNPFVDNMVTNIVTGSFMHGFKPEEAQ